MQLSCDQRQPSNELWSVDLMKQFNTAAGQVGASVTAWNGLVRLLPKC